MIATFPPVKQRQLNILKGKITRVIPRPLGADLVIQLAPGVKLISRLTAGAFAALNPKCGQMASAVIPAVDVIVSPDYVPGVKHQQHLL